MNVSAGRPDRDALRFERDRLDRRGEAERGPRRNAGHDQVAKAMGRAPVDPGRRRIIGEVIGDGDAIQRRAADEAADCIEVAIPLACRRKRIGSAVAWRRRDREPLEPRAERLSRFFLLARREAKMPMLDAPFGRPPIDGEAGLLRDSRPGVAIARVQPAAAEIERMAGNLISPCAPPPSRLVASSSRVEWALAAS